jgi:hypothetical protein
VVLFRIRDHGDVGEVFAVIQRDLTHADKSVRSTATSLALGLERCGRAGPVDRDAIRRAMELGLSPLARGIAEKFLKEMEG